MRYFSTSFSVLSAVYGVQIKVTGLHEGKLIKTSTLHSFHALSESFENCCLEILVLELCLKKIFPFPWPTFAFKWS